MKDVILGKPITEKEERDAIHIAVTPVVATEILLPGERIGFVAGSTERITKNAIHIGIVCLSVLERSVSDRAPKSGCFCFRTLSRR